MVTKNTTGKVPDPQPIGEPIPAWEKRPFPPRSSMEGDHCRLEPLDDLHAESLFESDRLDRSGIGWTYLAYGPFAELSAYRAWVSGMSRQEDPQFFAILDNQGQAVGVASYMRVQPEIGSIEVGHIHYSPRLQRTRAATECMYLMMQRVFDELGYRRYEWKCDALNAASRRAAERLGFVYEGTFRQATIYKGRNRDTAWYSIIDSEWPAIREAFEQWLSPANFDAEGVQRDSLVTRTRSR